MIDTLYDYGDFLRRVDANGCVGEAPRRPARVAVIGASAAGLAAAYELARVPNVTVHLLEAEAHLGGRMHSYAIDDEPHRGKALELGYDRFPASSTSLMHYLDRFGLRSSSLFPTPEIARTALFYRGRLSDWPAMSALPSDPAAAHVLESVQAIIRYLLGNANAPNRRRPTRLFDHWAVHQELPSDQSLAAVRGAWQSILDTYGEQTWGRGIYEIATDPAFLAQSGTSAWTSEDMLRFGAFGGGAHSFTPLLDLDFVEVLRWFANRWTDDQRLIDGGVVSLVDGFDRSLIEHGAVVRTRAEVTTIERRSETSCALRLEVGNLALPFDAVIVASSAPATRRHAGAGTAKLAVTTTTKFWYAQNNNTGVDLPANFQTDLGFQVYCLDYDSSHDIRVSGGKGVILISYETTRRPRSSTLNKRETLGRFVGSLRNAHPKFAQLLAGQIEDVESVRPTPRPYPIEYRLQSDRFTPCRAGSRLLLAGDRKSFAEGWIEGSLTSGINAACNALALVGGTPLAGSPLTIPQDLYRYHLRSAE